MTEELKPCPFCGGKPMEYPDGDMEGYSVMCLTDGCPLNTFGYETREKSINAWNTRAAAAMAQEGK